MKKLLLILFAVLFFTTCEKDTASGFLLDSNIQENSAANLRSPDQKIDVCHKGRIINISGKAVPAHRAHGDAVDMDGDGYFDQENDCSDGIDCKDNDPLINPGVEEVCDDEIDNNCNGLIDCDDEGCVEDEACLCGLNCTPVPYLINGLNLNLTQTGTADILANLFDAGSFDNCDCPLTFSFSEDPDDQSKTLDCDDKGYIPIDVWITNPAGNQDYGQTFIIVQDNMEACDEPLADCIPLAVAINLSTAILPNSQQVTVNATDFDGGSEDVCNTGQLTFSIRKQGDSNLPTESITLVCNDVGTTIIELWVSDGSNSSMVSTYVLLQDNLDVCP